MRRNNENNKCGISYLTVSGTSTSRTVKWLLKVMRYWTQLTVLVRLQRLPRDQSPLRLFAVPQPHQQMEPQPPLNAHWLPVTKINSKTGFERLNLTSFTPLFKGLVVPTKVPRYRGTTFTGTREQF